MRYLTGFALGDGEEKVAGDSGRFLVGGDEARRPGRLALHDPGSSGGARRTTLRGLPRPARALARADGVGRGEADRRSKPASCRTRSGSAWRLPRRMSNWSRSRAGSRRTGRSRNRPNWSGSRPPAPSRIGRWRRLLPEIRVGVTEADLALRLEWLMRTGWRRCARLRRRLPRRPAGRAAARCRPATGRSSRVRCCCSTSGRRSPATAAT